MIRLRHKLFVSVMRGLDPLILVASLIVCMSGFDPRESLRIVSGLMAETFHARDAAGAGLLLAGWLFIFDTLVRYDTDRLTRLKSELADVSTASAGAAFLLMVVAGLFGFGRVTTQVTLIFWAVATVGTMGVRVAARQFLMKVRRSGYNYRHLLIVGTNTRARKVAHRIGRTPALGYKLAGFVTEDDGVAVSGPEVAAEKRVLGRLAEVQQVLERGPVDEMIVCLPVAEHVSAIFQIVQLARELGIVARLMPGEADGRILSRLAVERFDGQNVVTLFRERLVGQLLAKRALDAVVSAVMLAILGPLLVVVAALIKLTSPGPVLFRQTRVGMNKRTFTLYKFRSMYQDAEARRAQLAHLNEVDGPVFKIKDDPRVTPLGRFIRKTSIDELPQLLNVLVGHMSLVGPRPPLPSEVDQYEWLFRKRLSIKPGITCLWQVSGRNQLSFREWMELDQRYIDNWSLWLDVKILFLTIPAVLSFKGAS